MSKKKSMTPSEQMVGRRIPPLPSHRDALLAGFVKPDGSFCGKSNPNERWLIPAFTKLRKEGMIYRGLALSLSGKAGKTDGIWYLREKAFEEALKSRERVDETHALRREWSSDFKKAHEKHLAEKEAETPQFEG